MENDITREIDRLRRRVREQDAVYDSLSVSFDDLKQKYHDLADVSYFKNASLAAANQWAEALRKEVDRLKAELVEAQKKLSIAEVKNRSSLANNLCPDHRDKQAGEPCLACTIETLKRKLAEAHSSLARQQYADLQLLGQRDEKIRHLENMLAEARGLLAKCLDWLSEYTDSELVTGIKAALAGEVDG